MGVMAAAIPIDEVAGGMDLPPKARARVCPRSPQLMPCWWQKFTIDIRFENLGLTITGSGKAVMQGVTGADCARTRVAEFTRRARVAGEIRHGRVTAVMGPSGARVAVSRLPRVGD